MKGNHDLLEAFTQSGRVFLVTLFVAFLPLLLFVPFPEWLPRLWVSVPILAIWAYLFLGYWERRVVTDQVLICSDSMPMLPGFSITQLMKLPAMIDGDVIKNYHWTYETSDNLPVEMSIQLALSSVRYRSAREEPRYPHGEWAHYAEIEMPELDTLTAEFQRLHLGRQWSTLDQAGNVIRFTPSCIEYRPDEETTPAAEWPRYPIETLMDEEGDCEDDVILSAAVLKRLGFEVALLYYPEHCALGVAGAQGLPGEFVTEPNGKLEYFYGETTAEGWYLGEVPKSYRGKRPEKIEPVHRVVNHR
jgi:hypothetical protein